MEQATAAARPQAKRSLPAGSSRALAYLRVSTFGQEAHGHNLEGQLAEIRAYCTRRGYALDDASVYRDIVSGARTDRAGYYQLLERIERADARVIVAYEVSRFGRNGLDNAWLLVKAKEYGLSLETVTGGTDFTRDPESEFQFDILSAVAKYERNAIMYRMLRGKKTGHKRGNWVTGTAPLGYTPTGPRGAKVLIPNGDAKIVRRIFTEYAEGASANAIAAGLLRDGVHPERGIHKGKWSPQGVTLILDCPAYVGLVSFQGDVAKGAHAAIVTQDAWDTVRRKREERRAKNPGRPRE